MSGFTEKEIISLVLVGTFITLLLAVFLVSFVFFYQRRHFAFLREKQQIRSQFQEELLKTRLEIQEETFRTISEEIHDNIGQTLSFIKLNLNTIDPPLPGRQEEKWQESKELLTRVIQDLRSLSRTLNTDFIRDIGLVGAVRQQLGLLERSGLYRIGLEVLGEKWPLPAARELVLYRVIQELLNNIVKHAEAAVIKVSMQYDAQLLTIVVADDGKGFEMEKPVGQERQGLGLRNVINRISLIGGTVAIDSAPGAGTRITLNITQSAEE
jgi:two-component system, NarL family, sensor kinase